MRQNYAFIDWQNLHLGTRNENWKVDIFKFRIYLRDKFSVTKAFYFLWCLDEDQQDLYNHLQEAGFIVVFRDHFKTQKWQKKGNVDTDIVFEMMKRFNEDIFDKVILVSWDWDYIKTVKWLIKKEKFEKVIFPNAQYSALYNSFVTKYGMNLSRPEIKEKIWYKAKEWELKLPI